MRLLHVHVKQRQAAEGFIERHRFSTATIMYIHAGIQAFSSGEGEGVQIQLTEKALTFLFFFGF